MGDGISLKWFDLANFSDKLSIPCGYLSFHKDFHALNVEHCFLVEPWWFYPFIKTTTPPIKSIRNEVQRVYRSSIKANKNIQFFINLSNYPVMPYENITYIFRDIRDPKLPADFLSHQINCFAGSLRASIMLAAYMGFDHVYLVGYDYTHLPSRMLHWYEKGEGEMYDHRGYQKDFFNLAREFIDITTVTLDSGSEFLPCVSYQDLTGKKPSFRENTELAGAEFLAALATWPGYTIY